MRLFPIAFVALALATTPARAEVTVKADNGFVVSNEVDVADKPLTAVWQALLEPAQWWNPIHSWSGDSANLWLDPQAGGCFCENLPMPKDAPGDLRKGSVEHMRVISAMPPRLLRLSGALGPLQGEALNGTLTITVKANPGGGAHVVFSYVVGGFMRMKVDDIAPVVDKVLGEQAQRFAEYAAARKDAPAPMDKDGREGHH
jgi:uncharacterized protein YndB with AHSA1/START domain